MKQKVSLKELVGTKIIYAGLIAAYYWMWGEDRADQRVPRHPSIEEGNGAGKGDSDCRCRQDLQKDGIGPAQCLDGLLVLFFFAVPADTGLQPGHRKRGADHRGYGDRRELSAGVPQ